MGKKKTFTASPITSYNVVFLGSTLDTFTSAYFIEEQKSSLVLLCAGTLSCNCLFIYLFIYFNKLRQEAGITHRASSSMRSRKTVYWYIGVFLGKNVP